MLRIAAGLVILVLVLYGAVKAWPLIEGPDIHWDTPVAYTSSPDGFITVSGVARNTEALYLDNGLLPIDTEGRFSKDLTLPPGGAILTLVARDRFGRTTTETRTVYSP